MAKVKRAILVQESLVERMDKLARELNVSRSQLFSLAADEFLQRHEGGDLLEAINRAYETALDPQEREQQQAMRHKQRRLMQGEW